MSIVKDRSVHSIQKIIEKLQQSLDTPVIQNMEIGEQNQHELDDLDIAACMINCEDEVEEVEEEEEEEEEEEVEEVEEEVVTESEVTTQETSARTIRALLSIVRMLIESGKIKRVVTSNDIQGAAFRGTTFTEKEKAVAAKIVNFLRPFVQQRKDDNDFPEPHILTRAPLAALANYIAKCAGFPSLVRKLSITSQNTRALHLTAAGVYETFREDWDIPVDNVSWITSSHEATRIKPATFGAFFKVNKMESLMNSYGLQFAWRLIFVDKWTVRLLGKAKPGKSFFVSNYELRKSKRKKKKGKEKKEKGKGKGKEKEGGRKEKEEVSRKVKDKGKGKGGPSEVDRYALEVKECLKALSPLRKELARLESKRMDLGKAVRSSSWDWASDAYRELSAIRQLIGGKRLEALRIEKALAEARGCLHAANKALQVGHSASPSRSSDQLEAGSREDFIDKVRFMVVIVVSLFFRLMANLPTF